MVWPKDDEIRWVQMRICEREALQSDKLRTDMSGQFDLRHYRAWMLHKADKLSFAAIGKRLFAGDGDGGDDPDNPDRLKRRAVLAYHRVEWELGRGPLKRERRPLGFAVSAPGIILHQAKPTAARPARKAGRVTARSRRGQAGN